PSAAVARRGRVTNRAVGPRPVLVPDRQVNPRSAGYQHEAIRRVAEEFTIGRRRALLVMVTGTRKARTVMGLIDTGLSRGGYRSERNAHRCGSRTQQALQGRRDSCGYR